MFLTVFPFLRPGSWPFRGDFGCFNSVYSYNVQFQGLFGDILDILYCICPFTSNSTAFSGQFWMLLSSICLLRPISWHFQEVLHREGHDIRRWALLCLSWQKKTASYEDRNKITGRICTDLWGVGCSDCSGCEHKAKCLYKYNEERDQGKNKVMKINERWENLKEETQANS